MTVKAAEGVTPDPQMISPPIRSTPEECDMRVRGGGGLSRASAALAVAVVLTVSACTSRALGGTHLRSDATADP